MQWLLHQLLKDPVYYLSSSGVRDRTLLAWLALDCEKLMLQTCYDKVTKTGAVDASVLTEHWMCSFSRGSSCQVCHQCWNPAKTEAPG